MERCRPIDPSSRGRHKTLKTAIDSALKSLMTEKSPFFDFVVENWEEMFGDISAMPSRIDGNTLYLRVATPALSYAIRPRLTMIKRKLMTLPSAPKRLTLYLEIKA